MKEIYHINYGKEEYYVENIEDLMFDYEDYEEYEAVRDLKVGGKFISEDKFLVAEKILVDESDERLRGN